VQEWRGLKVPGHVDEVLKAVKAIKDPCQEGRPEHPDGSTVGRHREHA